MPIDLEETFEKFNDEYLKFELVENKLSARPDLHAFLLLDRLVPAAGRDIVSASEHDEIFLETDAEKLAEAATEDDIRDLVRCGVMYSSEYESLSMFT